MEYPLAFQKEIEALLGSEKDDFFATMKKDTCRCLRLNPLRDHPETAALPYLRSENNAVAWEPCGRYVAADARPGASLAHVSGAFYLQDASAMAPVAVLDPQPGEAILDLCAAPGGKSGQIAGRMLGKGCLVANEYVKDRAQILKSNLERLGVTNAHVTSASPEQFEKHTPECFDAVLTDAPCSGEGMFRRDPGALTEWTEDAPAACALRQAYILDSAAKLVKPGGRLVYSTCTFNRRENEGSVEAFLSRHSDFFPEDFSLPGVGCSANGCLRLWPHRLEGEGHFVCRLRKVGTATPSVPRAAVRDKQTEAALSLLRSACARRLPEGNYVLTGDMLALESPFLPDLSGFFSLGPGLALGRIAKNYAEPHHSLAMAMKPEDALRTAELSAAEAGLYLQGEALPREGEAGWTLVCHAGLPLGWGKQSGDTLKNHLPKGLRLRGGHEIRE